MKNNVLIGFLLILSFLSCGKIKPKGEIVSTDISVEDFNKIELSGKFRVFYVQGSKTFVNVETYKNIAENVKIDVSDNTLHITERRPVASADFYNITVYSKRGIAELAAADSVEFNVSSEIKTDNFKLNLKNSAKFIGSIRTRRAEVNMQEHSLANFRGFTGNADMVLKDTASVVAPYWLVDHLALSLKNGSYAEVNVKDSLKGRVSDTSKLLYYNDPIRAFKIEKSATVNNKTLD